MLPSDNLNCGNREGQVHLSMQRKTNIQAFKEGRNTISSPAFTRFNFAASCQHPEMHRCYEKKKRKNATTQKYKNTQLAAGNQLGLLYDPPCWNWFFWQWLYHSFKPCADLFLIDSISHVSLWLSLWQQFPVRWSLQWSLLNAHNDKTSSIWSSIKHN